MLIGILGDVQSNTHVHAFLLKLWLEVRVAEWSRMHFAISLKASELQDPGSNCEEVQCGDVV